VWGVRNETECGAQLTRKERESDTVSSPYGSKMQMESRKKSVEQQVIKRWLRSTNKDEKEGRGGHPT
jgi:hypothetical protein